MENSNFSKNSKVFLLNFLFVFVCSMNGNAQTFKVLIFHKTNGFRHTGAIDQGNAMIKALGVTNKWIVDDSQNSQVFTVNNLANYNVVVWNNVTGSDLLNASERTAFEGYIKKGGGFVGIHGSTDCYRDKSWGWYNNLVGAIIQSSPNHSPNDTTATMDLVDLNHPVVKNLQSVWTKKEEWYYWEKNGGWLYDANTILHKVRSTGGNSYDAPRPITWCKEFDGGRSFYTALGHNGSDYVVKTEFGKLIENAILWVGAKYLDTSIFEEPNNSAQIYPNPASSTIFVNIESTKARIVLYDLRGSKLFDTKNEVNTVQLDVSKIARGLYILHIKGDHINKTEKIILK